jgi:hypothetical protein
VRGAPVSASVLESVAESEWLSVPVSALEWVSVPVSEWGSVPVSESE